MNRKNLIIVNMLIGLLMTVVSSCGENDDPQTKNPRIVLTEVGHDNSMTAVAGDDIHLEADLEAEGIIASISVVIMSTETSVVLVDEMFNDAKYIGKRNVEFHEHIDIPYSAAVGKYKLAMSVVDRLGNEITSTSEITITR